MKLYQRSLPGSELVSSLIDGKWIPFVLGGLLIILIGLLLTSGVGNPLALSFSKNPISLAQNDSTILEVEITNPGNEAAFGIVIAPQVINQEQLRISPESQTISSLGAQETRKLQFLVLPLNPDSNPFFPGNYRIDVKAEMNGKTYANYLFLEIEK